MAKVRLHLDADISYKSIAKALRERGHDVSRTPSNWIALDADDASQLREASARGRSILTFNIGDFVRLSRQFPEHRGIILAHQRDWTLSSLIAALDRLLSETTAEDWPGQVRWLNDWRESR